MVYGFLKQVVRFRKNFILILLLLPFLDGTNAYSQDQSTKIINELIQKAVQIQIICYGHNDIDDGLTRMTYWIDTIYLTESYYRYMEFEKKISDVSVSVEDIFLKLDYSYSGKRYVKFLPLSRIREITYEYKDNIVRIDFIPEP